ncbi:hypothetical protein AB4Z37_07500 [Bradyrhizobium sp. 2TAF24]
MDAQGRRVLVGLDFAETAEFVRLEAAIAEPGAFVSLNADEWRSPAERRWLALYEKHLAALRLRRCGPPR